MSYETGDRYLDGPKFAEWISPRLKAELQGVDKPSYLRWACNLQRRIAYWREGQSADLYLIEPYLFTLGIHPLEIPDELWRGDSPKEGPRK